MSERRTPLSDWHLAHKGRMVPFAGWSMPVQYTGIVEEHQAVRTSAGLFDISHMARFVLEGADAEGMIQLVWTNDASGMKIGQVRYGLICDESGGVLDDVLIYRFGPFWMMVVNASNREKILAWLTSHRGERDVTLTDRTEDLAMLAIQGPAALQAAAPVIGDYGDLRNYGATLEARSGQFSTFAVSRTGYTGEDGLEVILPAAEAVCLADALVERGVRPCGLGARDTLRLEAGMPLYGHELGEEIDPIRAGLGWAVKPNKGEFIGRDALQRSAGVGEKPVRVGLELEGKRAAREGYTVRHDGRDVGRVTSGSYAPTLERSIAMAYLIPSASAEGTVLDVDIRGRSTAARVVPLPFYRRAR